MKHLDTKIIEHAKHSADRERWCAEAKRLRRIRDMKGEKNALERAQAALNAMMKLELAK